MAAWSLEVLGVPLYPQARFQLAVAAEAARKYELDREIRAEVLGAVDRFSGERKRRMLRGRAEILGR